MSEVFGSLYANIYDALYHDKDYSAECDMIEGIFDRYGESSVKSILDLVQPCLLYTSDAADE